MWSRWIFITFKKFFDKFLVSLIEYRLCKLYCGAVWMEKAERCAAYGDIFTSQQETSSEEEDYFKTLFSFAGSEIDFVW